MIMIRKLIPTLPLYDRQKVSNFKITFNLKFICLCQYLMLFLFSQWLLQAIGTLYPCAEHRFCLRHIHENMKKMWRGKVFQDMLWNCASTTTIQEFNHAMEDLRKLNNDCYEWVKAISPQHWSRAHFTGLFYFVGLIVTK